MRWTLLVALFATGCYSESDFVPAKTDAFCSLLLECTDPAVLAFDGFDETSCIAYYGPLFRAEGETCKKMKRSAAKDCVAALELATCPAEGTVEESIPAVCGQVWQKCTGVPEDTDTPDTDTPQDTSSAM